MATIYLDGKWLNAGKAGIGVDNRSFRYGDGCFETIKCIKGNFPLWKYHVARLLNALDVLKFEIPSFFTAGYILDAINELIRKNQHTKLARVRITIFRGDGGIYDAISHRPHLLIQSWELNPENNKLNENGLVTGAFPEGFKAADTFANLKSNNYLLYVMAAMHAKLQHWNDALVLNHYGHLCDATIANIWVVKDEKLFTPPLSEGPVAGTMRQYLLDGLANAGFVVAEKPLSPVDIRQADELFLSNAIYGIKWVKQFEEVNFTNHSISRIHTSLVAPLWAATL